VSGFFPKIIHGLAFIILYFEVFIAIISPLIVYRMVRKRV
jgi:hypothetical protein